MIERERINGAQILSQKGNGGGYYLPACEYEVEEYLSRKYLEVFTDLEVILGIKNKKRVPIDTELKRYIQTL